MIRRREEGVEISPQPADLPPAVAHYGQQLRGRRTDLFRRGVRVEQFVEQILDARVLDHGARSLSAGARSRGARLNIARVQIAERGGQHSQAAVEAPMDRHDRNLKNLRRLGLRYS